MSSEKLPLFFSIIVPVFNRPLEIEELLDSLTKQVYHPFEVLIIDDGSKQRLDYLVSRFENRLDLSYHYIPNGGQGMARNLGFSKAKGDYFIVFDSDCLIPPNYLQIVNSSLRKQYLDAFGGPDAADPAFTIIQKAINYAMTSPLTTGGIRGNKHHVGTFHPRSFNMGISKEVWQQTKGFLWSNQSEDMEFSIRMQKEGWKVGLIHEAFVFHKRRTSLSEFFKQTFSFGAGRIRIYRHFGDNLKLVHTLPSLFTLGVFVVFLLNLALLIGVYTTSLAALVTLGNSFLLFYTCCLFIHSLSLNKSFMVACYSVLTSYIQLFAYGLGFLNRALNIK